MDWKGAEQSGIYAENFFSDNPISLLRKQSAQLFAKAGKIVSVGDMIAENNLRGRCRIKCEFAELEIYFTLTPENPSLIQEFRISELSSGR
jgi:hypothetical protein